MARSINRLPEKIVLFRIANRVEEALLCLLLLSVIFLACSQIALRIFFSTGLIWIEPLLRYLVLWGGLLGAVTATGKGKHIALDIFGGKLPDIFGPTLSLIAHIFCSCAAAGLTWAGCLFLGGELEFGGNGPLSLPLWLWNIIFPVSFGLITLKYVLLTFFQLRELIVPTSSKAIRVS